MKDKIHPEYHKKAHLTCACGAKHEVGSTVEKMEVEAYNVFGPKVIATRKEFNDYAIKSRCLTMDMVPMVPHPSIPQSLPPEKELQDLHLRNLWTTFRMKVVYLEF